MVAASPERHDGGLQANPVEVQSYQPPWKVLSDFALQSDIDQPAFQQLVSVSSQHTSPPARRFWCNRLKKKDPRGGGGGGGRVRPWAQGWAEMRVVWGGGGAGLQGKQTSREPFL